MWSIAMAGGYANWYIGTTAWDVPPPLNCPLEHRSALLWNSVGTMRL
jgi:hypothetical protein